MNPVILSLAIPVLLSWGGDRTGYRERSAMPPEGEWTGTYGSKYGIVLKITGPDSEGAVKFELLQGSESCQEMIEGTAFLTDNSVAHYVEDDGACHINFTYNPGQIEIREYDCSHGAFDGIYRKKKANNANPNSRADGRKRSRPSAV